MILRRLQQLAFIALASCAPQIAADGGPFAMEAGDPTALLSGCGSPANVGYLYCRMPEGWAPTGDVRVVIPPVTCGLESCATIVVFRPDGGRTLDVAVPTGTTHVSIPWSSLVGTDPLERSHRGFWPVLVKWVWLNEDGLLESAIAEGEIRLRVYRKDYNPLGAEPARWIWKLGGITFRVTERGRAFVEGGGSK